MIISVTSAAADGATTTAVGMALTWPRACWLVEADPAGGSAVLAGYLGGRHVHDRCGSQPRAAVGAAERAGPAARTGW